MRLAGRRVLVTGAASGIGLAIARLFRREGAALAMLDRDEAGLKAAQVDGAVTLTCDVAEERQVRDAVARATDGHGVVQTDVPTPPEPSGATGWHYRGFTVV